MDRIGSGAALRWGLALSLLLVPSWTQAQVVRNQAGTSMVRAVLFYSPTCPHCEELIRVTLPPMLRRYGDRLDVVGISIASQSGADMYRAVIEHFIIPESRQGVPTLVIGSTVLVGGNEIPAELPGMIDRALAGDGIDWPAVPAMRASLQVQGLIPPPPESARPQPAPTAPAGRDTAKPPGTRSPDSLARDSSARAGAVAAPGSRGVAGGSSGTAVRSDPARRPDSARTAAAPTTARTQPGPARAELEARGAPPPPTSVGAAEESDASAVSTAAPGDAALAGDTAPAGDAALAGDTTLARHAARTPGDSLAASAFTRDMGLDLDAMTMSDRFRLDPAGNTAAVAVLILLGAALLFTAFTVFSPARGLPPRAPWRVPALAVAGMAVAAYLAWVEVTGVDAVCGPVGDCNTVQQSAYARLFGVPVGLLGLGGYAAMLASWVLSTRGSGRTRRMGHLLVWSMALVATLFSTYLTFLEPFVIGATCAWCLSSSVIAASVLLLTTPAVRGEFRPRLEPEA